MVKLIDLFHSKLELFRLEQRYTRRRNRRSTFVSEAQYVDGEYIYANTTLKSTYSAQVTGGSSTSNSSNDSSNSAMSGEQGPGQQQQAAKEEKIGRRLSMMAKSAMDWRQGGPGKAEKARGVRADKRLSRVSVREIQWDGGVRS